MQAWFKPVSKPINAIQHVNQLKDGNHMIIFRDARETLDNVEHFFIMDVLKKQGLKGTYLKILRVCNAKL